MKEAIITIYDDGSMDRAPISAGDLRSIGQQLIAMADGVMIRGTVQNEEQPEIINELTE